MKTKWSNKSLEPTAVGAGCSAIAVHATSLILLLFLLIGVIVGCASHDITETSTSPVPEAVVYIGGHEVHNQGAYPWHSGMTVKDIIKAADGLSDFAIHSRIRVIHADGTQDNYKYARILTGETKVPALQPGDKVYVITPYF